MSYCDWCGFYVENKDAECGMCGNWATRPNDADADAHPVDPHAPERSRDADAPTTGEADQSPTGSWWAPIALTPVAYVLLAYISYSTNTVATFGYFALGMMYVFAVLKDIRYVRNQNSAWTPNRVLWLVGAFFNILFMGVPSFILTPYYLYKRRGVKKAARAPSEAAK